MASPTFFRQHKENLAKAVSNYTSDATCTITLALLTHANIPLVTNSVLADLTPISYTNASARVLTSVTAEHTAGTVLFTAGTWVLTAGGGAIATFRHIALYDDDPTSPADPLICWYDTGSDRTLLDTQTLTMTFSAGGWATLT